ncbi:MAG: hypothetical protein EBE86_027625 [Hormoscilla sp. GUM202]|nr:hypothetical protein [Hormoscilla sp. GUM202]
MLSDENFDNTIVRGLLRRRPSIDIVRVQDVGLSIEDIIIILDCSLEGELEGQIHYIPF